MRNLKRTMMVVIAASAASGIAVAGDGKPTPAGGAVKPAPGMAKPQPAPGMAKPPQPAPGMAKPPEPKPPAMSMEMPKPAPALLEVFKGMKGTWSCTGTVHMPDGASRPSVATMKYTQDLDKLWLRVEMTEKSKTPYKFNSFISYDGTTKKWTQVMVDNMGAYGVSTSDGVTPAGVATWLGTATGMGLSIKSKLVETIVSPKERKLDSQSSMDGGKTWMADYQGTCKK